MKLPLLFVLLALLPFSGAAEEAGKTEKAPKEERLGIEDIPTSILRAKVGDWVQYKTAKGDTSRYTVVEKWQEHGEDYLILRNDFRQKGGKKPVVTEERICVQDSVKNLLLLSPLDYITKSSVLVDGRSIKAVVINFIEGGELVAQTYLSDRIPVFGLLRGIEINGEDRVVALSLHDYGFADEDD